MSELQSYYDAFKTGAWEVRAVVDQVAREVWAGGGPMLTVMGKVEFFPPRRK